MPSPSPVVHRVNGVDLPPTSSPNSETPKSKLVNVQVCKIELKPKLRRCYDGAHDAVESRAAAIQLQPTAQCQPFRHMNSEFTVG